MPNRFPIHKIYAIKKNRAELTMLFKKITFWQLFKYGAMAAVVCFFLFTVFVAWAMRDLPDPNKLSDRVVVQSTKMYDRTGQHLLYEVYDEKKRTLVDVAALPRYIVDATISIEDKDFYQHGGIQWRSLVRAAISDVLHLSSGRGGASTLTQQLVKNAILTNERSFARKIREAILAIQIERYYNKEQILKLYFNEIPYGSTNYGIESAAQAYYKKPAKDLTLAEAATLAALPQAPTRYLHDSATLKGRRDYVLTKMKEYGYITEAQMIDAKKQNTDIKPELNETIAPHFVLYLKDLLVDEFGEQAVDQGGMKVITTLDYDMQVAANTAIKNGLDVASKKYGATNGALVALDPKTGEILAMVGSRDFFDEKNSGQFNVVTQGLRQPGSSFKPIVYSAAFEKGFPPDTVLFDTETDFPYDGKTYHPHNYDGKEHGPVTMRQALQGSLNIPAVKTIFLVGVDNALDYAERLGYTTFKNRSQFGPSVVLGGGGVKLIEHARAFSVFANGGSLVEPVGFIKVEDKDGKDVTPERVAAKNVLAPEVSATVSSVLSDNAARAFVFGGKNYLTLPDRPVAAKTGTTNDYHDAWTLGYIPQLTAGVWVGNNDNKPMKGGADGSVVAAPIWQAFMKEAIKKLPAVGFPEAPANLATKPMLRGLVSGGITVSVDSITGKLATEDTPPETTEKRTYVPVHDILYYVTPDDPLGPAPENPADNSQFAAWEAGVAAWAEKHPGTLFGEPPTTYDDVHKKELRPTVVMIYPQTGNIITTPDFSTQVQISAPRGIVRVEYRLDGALIGMVNQFPYTITYSLATNKVTKGNHTLKVTAFDDLSNAASQEVSFQYIGF